MHRRAFLRLFGAVAAAPLVPLGLRWLETNPIMVLDSAGEISPLGDLGRIQLEPADVLHEWRYDPLCPRSRVADPEVQRAQQRLTAHLPQVVDFYRSDFGDILIKPSRYNRGRN